MQRSQALQHVSGLAPNLSVQQNAFEAVVNATRPGIDDATWEEVKQYIESEPDMAQDLQKFARNPEAMRASLHLQPFVDLYHTKLANDASVEESKALEHDSELAPQPQHP